VLLDREEEVAHHYGFWSYPVTVVIDAEGTIVAIHGGPVSREELEADLPGGDPS
jgi:peroxiredoxin